MAETKVTLKLLIDSKANKVLFAEAGKDFVDFLFHIMSLPTGTIVNLLGPKDFSGSLGELHKSIASLSTDYFQENIDKDAVLKPKAAVNVPLLSLEYPPRPPTERKFYTCCSGYAHVNKYFAEDPNVICPSCNNRLSALLTYIPSESSTEARTSSTNCKTGGYVKGLLTYMVMDNLEVKPMSTISAITLFRKFDVKDVASLLEQEVQVGLNEGVAIVKAVLETRAVLTTVFLGENMK